MDAITEFAAQNDFWIVEDAAEAHGASYFGENVSGRAGSLAQSGVFSFYGNKPMTTGEGGMLTTNNESLANHARLYRGQGQGNQRYMHEVLGYNYRMTEIAAALGIAQLGRLEEGLSVRRIICDAYRAAVSGYFDFQEAPLNSSPSCWMFVVLVPRDADRDAVMLKLQGMDVETRPVFISMTDQPAYEQQELPVASDIAKRGICLPTHAAMTVNDVQIVVKALKEALK
jgi:perosamine synthetase